MSETEANWHGHLSAMVERQKVEASGGDSEVMASLLGTAAAQVGAPMLGDYQLQPLSVGTFEVMQLAESLYAKENPDRKPMLVSGMEMARTALIFARPEWAYDLLANGRREEFSKEALAISFKMTAEVMRAVNDFVTREMDAFFGPEATEKKPPSGSQSPEAPQPEPPLSGISPLPSQGGSQH